MATRGESPEPFFNFWERLQRNPSHHSVTQLWDFMNHCGIPLTPDGCFLAYKGVKSDLKDAHSGRFDNSPGQTHEMARNLVSDDPSTPCHVGFHVGALEYAKTFSAVTVIVKVDPEHVVSVPSDHSFQKMRVCKYSVEGFYGAQLPSTTLDEEFEGSEEDENDDESGIEQGADLAEGCDCTDSDLAEGRHRFCILTGEEAVVKPKPVAKRWSKLNAMGAAELMDQAISRLRLYAGKGLKIIGATKIPGGKASLIMRILDVRGH